MAEPFTSEQHAWIETQNRIAAIRRERAEWALRASRVSGVSALVILAELLERP